MTQTQNKLLEKINQDFLIAFKAKDEQKVSTLRILKSALQNKEKEQGQAPDEAEIIKIIQQEIKKCDQAIQDFQKVNRKELAEKEAREKIILQGYLPKQLSDQEIETIIDEIIQQTGATQITDMGKVMGAAITKTSGKASGEKISQLVKQKLSHA
ncbi:MAG: hypothetical protein CEN89_568 [Candidatus Berkelbacteria bacterium Licking1014_7]|uniref:GatB/YqeY domain-containing protein n=1 Tax=Candidatus Berkelbacteria bacterium Licking1014_7 TaxID=2017147 RepID=A0A554LIG3_9BACT|nr:MAG: hypothetical protein CEN89_568 [Candidatus Berkelbacteria bacterium Licking1014_7]